MKIRRKNLNNLITIVLSLMLAGCSWFRDSPEPENASYEAGKKALSEGNFEEAKSHLRDITLDSPFYPQAVRMIQKVPFKKGVAAYEQKQFEFAISELSKVPLHSPDYAEAQHYMNLINYKKLYDQLQDTSKAAEDSNFNVGIIEFKDVEEYKRELLKCRNYHDLILKKFISIENKMPLAQINGKNDKNPIVFSNTRNCNKNYINHYFERLSKKQNLSIKDVEEYDIVLITKLVNIAEQLGDSTKVLESFDFVKSGIKQSSSRRKTEDFLMLLESIVASHKEREVHENALNFLLTYFEHLYKQTEIRPHVFQIIGKLKMELM